MTAQRPRHARSPFVRFTAFSLVMLAVAVLCGQLLIKLPREAKVVDASATPPVTVILDAGHGGRDGGASAEDGTLEKHLNLAVTKKLASLFAAADIRVLMTRETDVELADPRSSHKKRDDLNARLSLAAQEPDALFISIHMNKFPVEKYYGMQVYYSPNHEKSPLLADAVKERGNLCLDKNNERRPCRADSSIYLLSHIENPAVLVECGFLSNQRESSLLKSSAYQEKLALTLYAAILDYIDGAPVTKKDGTG